jgi:hypothetical protein
VVIVSSNFMFVSAGIALVCYALYWALILPFREWADIRRTRRREAAWKKPSAATRRYEQEDAQRADSIRRYQEELLAQRRPSSKLG